MTNVIVINPFEGPENMESEALKAWDTFAEWESAEDFQAALDNPARITDHHGRYQK